MDEFYRKTEHPKLFSEFTNFSVIDDLDGSSVVTYINGCSMDCRYCYAKRLKNLEDKNMDYSYLSKYLKDVYLRYNHDIGVTVTGGDVFYSGMNVKAVINLFKNLMNYKLNIRRKIDTSLPLQSLTLLKKLNDDDKEILKSSAVSITLKPISYTNYDSNKEYLSHMYEFLERVYDKFRYIEIRFTLTGKEDIIDYVEIIKEFFESVYKDFKDYINIRFNKAIRFNDEDHIYDFEPISNNLKEEIESKVKNEYLKLWGFYERRF